jgi:hypothetical protein
MMSEERDRGGKKRPLTHPFFIFRLYYSLPLSTSFLTAAAAAAAAAATAWEVAAVAVMPWCVEEKGVVFFLLFSSFYFFSFFLFSSVERRPKKKNYRNRNSFFSLERLSRSLKTQSGPPCRR